MAGRQGKSQTEVVPGKTTRGQEAGNWKKQENKKMDRERCQDEMAVDPSHRDVERMRQGPPDYL